MDNPYAATSTAIAQEQFVEPEQLVRHIRHGAFLACFSGALTLAGSVAGMAGASSAGLDAWNLIDVGLIFGLAYGIWRRSRAAATVMLLYFIASKLLVFMESGQPSGLAFGLLFAYLYARAMIATYRLHALRRAALG